MATSKFDIGNVVWFDKYNTTALVLDVQFNEKVNEYEYYIQYCGTYDWWREYFLSPYFVQNEQKHTKTYGIKKVIYNNPATIILWEDGTKTVVKVQNGDTYSKELGFAMCVSKKYFGNQSNFNNVFKKYVYDTEQE